jgi:hypothetical protein
VEAHPADGGQGAQGGTRSPCPHPTAVAQVQGAPVGSCSRRPHRLQLPLPPRCRHGPGPPGRGGVALGGTHPPVHRRWALVPCVGDPVTSSPYYRGLHSVPVPHGHGPAPYVLYSPHPSPCCLQASLPATLPAAPAGTEMDDPWGPSPHAPVDVVPPRCEPLGCQGAPWPVRNCSRRPHGLQSPLPLPRRHSPGPASEVGAVPGGDPLPRPLPLWVSSSPAPATLL